MIATLRTSVVFLVMMTVLTGLIYPGVVTLVAQVALPDQANGSLVTAQGRAVGSKLVGQAFSDPKYFWGRLSATAATPYNAVQRRTTPPRRAGRTSARGTPTWSRMLKVGSMRSGGKGWVNPPSSG